MAVEVAGMTDEAETMEPLASRAYDGPKSAVRARPDRGVEVRVRPVRRRSWPDEDKLRMVRETLAAGAVVQVVADRSGVGTGQLYTWRKELLAAAVSGFVPVAVAPEVRMGGISPGWMVLTRILAPPSGASNATIEPPWASATWRAKLSPTPLPPLWVV